VNVVAYIPAPALCQGADEDVILEISEIVFPDFVHRNKHKNGLQMKVAGNYLDKSRPKIASDQFQILLGILRAWRSVAGQRVDEIRPGIGEGSIRDEHGNQVVMLGSVISYALVGAEVEAYARQAKVAVERSRCLRNALWLHGRRDRNSADFFMIYEYAEMDFAGRKAIVSELGVADRDIGRLKNSANNLAPTEGGRHATETGTTEWSLDDQREFVAKFLNRWIAYRSRAAA
jgi:hypothetical protein